MKSLICAILLSAGLAAVSAPQLAQAQVGISLNLGNVSVGYRDGYFDRYHRWHRWSRVSDWRYWCGRHSAQCHNYNYNRYGGAPGRPR